MDGAERASATQVVPTCQQQGTHHMDWASQGMQYEVTCKNSFFKKCLIIWEKFPHTTIKVKGSSSQRKEKPSDGHSLLSQPPNIVAVGSVPVPYSLPSDQVEQRNCPTPSFLRQPLSPQNNLILPVSHCDPDCSCHVGRGMARAD